jgi:ABC-type multidrug transport system ATPase subunit
LLFFAIFLLICFVYFFFFFFSSQLWQKEFKRKLAYVRQEDLFFQTLTVREQLSYTALLRLPAHMSRVEKLNQVDKTIEILGIKKCEHSQIMMLSGGERKRVVK